MHVKSCSQCFYTKPCFNHFQPPNETPPKHHRENVSQRASTSKARKASSSLTSVSLPQFPSCQVTHRLHTGCTQAQIVHFISTPRMRHTLRIHVCQDGLMGHKEPMRHIMATTKLMGHIKRVNMVLARSTCTTSHDQQNSAAEYAYFSTVLSMSFHGCTILCTICMILYEFFPMFGHFGAMGGDNSKSALIPVSRGYLTQTLFRVQSLKSVCV